MNTQKTDIVPLGSLPRPTSGDDLATRVRTALQTGAGVADESAQRLQVAATLDGADVATLDVDLTGVVVSPREAKVARERAASFAPTSREPGTIRRLRVEAHPVTVSGAPVDVLVDVADVPFEWVEGAQSELGLAPVEPTESAPVTGSARLSVSAAALEQAVERVATQVARGHGLTLTKLDAQFAPAGSNGVAVTVHAQVRKGVLSATVEAGANATVDDALGVTLSDVRATSRNPVVAALLVAARSRVERYEGRRMDLAASLPAGVRLTDVRVEVGTDLVLSARAH